MKKKEFLFFKKEVLKLLSVAPVASRQQWSERELFIWWFDAEDKFPELRWNPKEPLWQHVRVFCHGHYGKNIEQN